MTVGVQTLGHETFGEAIPRLRQFVRALDAVNWISVPCLARADMPLRSRASQRLTGIDVHLEEHPRRAGRAYHEPASREYEIFLVPEDEGGCGVFVPELPSVATQGETVEEAVKMAKQAIERG